MELLGDANKRWQKTSKEKIMLCFALRWSLSPSGWKLIKTQSDSPTIYFWRDMTANKKLKRPIKSICSALSLFPHLHISDLLINSIFCSGYLVIEPRVCTSLVKQWITSTAMNILESNSLSATSKSIASLISWVNSQNACVTFIIYRTFRTFRHKEPLRCLSL